MNKAKRLKIIQALAQDRPDPKTELHFSSHFELLIAVMLSAQSTDVRVNWVTDRLFPLANTPENLLEYGEQWLIEQIKTIGLYRAKAKHIIETCRLLLECHNGVVPADREALEKLPGVGRKTANVVLNEAFGLPTIAVDTHVFRVSNRTGLAPGKNPLDVEKKLEKVIPDAYKKPIHILLILHGRHCCKARNPQCTACPIEQWCEYPDKFGA